MDEKNIYQEIVHLARIGLSGRRQDLQLFVRRLAKKIDSLSPDTSEALRSLLKEQTSFESPVRNTNMTSIPVDRDSRLQLVKFEHVVQLQVEPILPKELQQNLQLVVDERKHLEQLEKEGLLPTRSLLFSGKPGVGKTLAARWLAHKLNLPLLILDLSAVMSSFLGRTGNNMRNVFDYAKGTNCVLLLDELDTIAKRRDDTTEIGELKRLVNVLLQELDDWPPTGLLVAATNHAQLLDPAIWRRFDLLLEFPLPDSEQILVAIDQFMGAKVQEIKKWKPILSYVFEGSSYSDIERDIANLRRNVVVRNSSLEDSILTLLNDRFAKLPRKERIQSSLDIVQSGFSQRMASDITGVSRDTIRKKINISKSGKGGNLG